MLALTRLSPTAISITAIIWSNVSQTITLKRDGPAHTEQSKSGWWVTSYDFGAPPPDGAIARLFRHLFIRSCPHTSLQTDVFQTGHSTHICKTTGAGGNRTHNDSVSCYHSTTEYLAYPPIYLRSAAIDKSIALHALKYSASRSAVDC